MASSNQGTERDRGHGDGHNTETGTLTPTPLSDAEREGFPQRGTELTGRRRPGAARAGSRGRSSHVVRADASTGAASRSTECRKALGGSHAPRLARLLPGLRPRGEEGVDGLSGLHPAAQVPGQPVAEEQRGEALVEVGVEEQRLAGEALGRAPQQVRHGDAAPARPCCPPPPGPRAAAPAPAPRAPPPRPRRGTGAGGSSRARAAPAVPRVEAQSKPP